MQYTEITAAVPAPQRELAADVLREATGAGTWVEVPFSQPDLESEAQADADGVALVRLCAPALDASAMLDAAARALRSAGIEPQLSQRPVAEEDWAEAWKDHFHVERFGERIVVVPSWRSFAPRPDDLIITLDPGMAFGTGQHETTRMCLEAIERCVLPGMTVLDLGCGSGILSLAAAKLGAREVLALDIDADCVRVTRENAQINGVDAVVRVEAGSLGSTWPCATPPSGRFDVVVANIVARVIVELAPAVVEALAPGGRLIVSGVIAAREREVAGALAAAGARVDDVRTMGEWRCIEAVRA